MKERLDIPLLYKIMQRIGEARASYPNLMRTSEMMDLVQYDRTEQSEQDAYFYLCRHVAFLEKQQYLTSGWGEVGSGKAREFLQLTGQGEIFVQPELAEFANTSLLPDVIRNLEANMAKLTLPEPDRETLLFRLRDAFAKKAPDLIASALTQIGLATAKAHGVG